MAKIWDPGLLIRIHNTCFLISAGSENETNNSGSMKKSRIRIDNTEKNYSVPLSIVISNGMELTVVNVGACPGVPVGVGRGPGDDARLQRGRLRQQVVQVVVG